MSNSSANFAADIDIAALGRLVVRGVPRLIILSLAVACVTYGVLSLMAPRYEAEAQLSIGASLGGNAYGGAGALSPENMSVRMDREAINTHVRALQSTDLSEAVVQELALKDRKEFNSALGPEDQWSGILRLFGIGLPRAGETERNRVLSAYYRHLEVYVPKESRTIGIRFSSSDAELAARVANTLADRYRASLSSRTISEASGVQKALAEKIDVLTREAAQAETAVDAFRGRANIFKGGQQQTGLNEQQLTELSAELSKAKGLRSEAEARARQAQEMLHSGSADALPDVQKAPLIQSLVQSRVLAERQISELSATLLPGHPRMRQLSADLAGLKAQLKTEIAKVVDSLSKEANVAALREKAIAENLAEIKSRIVDTGPDEAKLRGLLADASSKRGELERLKSQFEANRVRLDDSRTVPVEAQLLSRALAASIPTFPRMGATSALAALATFLLGIAAVVTRGLLGGVGTAQGTHWVRMQSDGPDLADGLKVSSTRAQADAGRGQLDVARDRGFDLHKASEGKNRGGDAGSGARSLEPEKVMLPAGGKSSARASSIVELADVFESMRKRGETGLRAMLVAEVDTFTFAQEVRELAENLCQRHVSVLIVDWNLESAGIAEAIGHTAWPGVVELVKGQAAFDEVIGALGSSGVQIIPAGRGAGQAGEEIDPGRVNAVLDALDGTYDHILVAGRREPSSALFEAIEGRFDCGVIVAPASSKGQQRPLSPAGVFLGFEVEGFDVIVLERTIGATKELPRTYRHAN